MKDWDGEENEEMTEAVSEIRALCDRLRVSIRGNDYEAYIEIWDTGKKMDL